SFPTRRSSDLPSGVGGGTFFGLRRKRPTTNVQPMPVRLGPMSKSESSGRVAWPVALTLIAIIVAAVVVIVFLRLESWPARTAHQGTAELERLGKDLRSAFVDIAHLQP